MPVHDRWLALARSLRLGVLADLDGTLIPFAPTPDQARPDSRLIALLERLVAAPGVTAAIVSGRPQSTLADYFDSIAGLSLIAEHGGWRRGEREWEALHERADGAIDDLAKRLAELAARHPGALIERKTWSVAFHYRMVPGEHHAHAIAVAEQTIAPWLSEHQGFERLPGAEVIEVRPLGMNKSSAVGWMKGRLGPDARLLVLGDDVTDEDMFAALGPDDESVIVGGSPRITNARARLSSVHEARNFLEWLIQARTSDALPAVAVAPRPIESARGAAHP